MQNSDSQAAAALNRATAPAFRAIERIDVPVAERTQLDNGVPVYLVNAGTQEVVRIEVVFEAGNWYQNAPMIAAVANALISGGTASMTAEQIAERFDFYGAYISLNTNMDHASVTLYTLNKYLEPTLALFQQVIREASYPEREVETHVRNTRQEFLVNQEKVGVLSRRHFRSVLHGANHRYGSLATVADFDNINQQQLLNFKAAHYHGNCATIVVAGKVPAELMGLLNQHFGSDWEGPASPEYDTALNPQPTGRTFIEKEDAIQSAIRIGRYMVPRSHEDFMPMQLLNAVLGGYFGSRLMSNIREDKGYTYGIGSAVVAWHRNSQFFIATEVGAEVTEAAIEEIYKELALLRDQPIPEDELQLVKNYLLGNLLKSIDGPFSLADRLKPLFLSGLDESYYHRFVESIHGTGAEKLQALAQQYFKNDAMLELVAGNKNAISAL